MKKLKFNIWQIIFALIFCAAFISEAQAQDMSFVGAPTVSKKEASVIADAVQAQKNSREAAKEILSDAAKKQWAGGAIFFNLANLHYQDGDYSQAANFYKAAIEKNQGFFQARKNLGFAYVQLNKRAEAFEELKNALAICGGSDVQILMWFAAKYSAEQNFSAALNCVNQALIYAPENESAKIAKMDFLCRLDSPREAANMAEDFLKKDISNKSVWLILAKAKLLSADEKGAASTIESMRLLKVSDENCDNTLAQIYLKNGACLRASELFCELQNEDLRLAGILNCAKAFLSRGDYFTAEKLCDEILKKSKNAEALKLKALSVSHGKNKSAAENFLRKALLENPDDALLSLELARVCADLKNFAEAKSILKTCVDVQETKLNAYVCLLRISVAENDISEAQRITKIIASIRPDGEILKYLKYLESLKNVEKPSL